MTQAEVRHIVRHALECYDVFLKDCKFQGSASTRTTVKRLRKTMHILWNVTIPTGTITLPSALDEGEGRE